MKLVILDGYAVNPGDLDWSPLRRFGELTVYDRTAPEEIVPRIGDAEVIFTNKTPITAATLDACPSLRLVSVLATGYNVVDCEAAAARGVAVCNVPAYSTDAVAQATFALLLEICNHVGAHSESVHAGDWERSRDFCYWNYPLIELSGKTLGIIGFGRIGKAVGRIARAMNLRVLACGSRETDEGRAIATYTDLPTLLAQSDIVSLHCPLFPETKGIIDRRAIVQMKPGAILLNLSRGQLINEQDVADALNSGRLAAAGMDVVSREPISGDNPLLTARNCFLTPHIAWASLEARGRIIEISAENVRAFTEGAPQNVVNGVI